MSEKVLPHYSSLITVLKAFRSRVNVFGVEFDCLLASGNGHGQAPFDALRAGKRCMNPPLAGRHCDGRLPSVIQLGLDGGAPLHVFCEEIFEPDSRVALE